MEDYIQQLGGLSSSPPSYEVLFGREITNSKYKIEPREEEGRENLPIYSCAISLEGVFIRKLELQGAVHQAQDRSWNKVITILQGTALKFHKLKRGGSFSASETKIHNLDMLAGAKRGRLLKSYSLQHADVGIAADYVKKKYVIRVRAEADQFLLSCTKIETFVLWLQSLSAAIDLAPPLDEREIPRDLSIPRPRRRRIIRSNIAPRVELNAALVRQQEEIMRTQFPRLAAATATNVEENRDVPSAVRAYSSNGRTQNDGAETTLTSMTSMHPRQRMDNPQHTIPENSSVQLLHPSVVSDTGKWQPEHQCDPLLDAQYASRCMAVLTRYSPRRSNFIIINEKQWVVDWETGVVTRCGPPDYSEVQREKENVRPRSNIARAMRIGHYGDFVVLPKKGTKL